MRSVRHCLAIVAISVVVSVNQGKGEEQAVPLEQLPKAVSEAVMKMFPKAEMLKASQEDEEGGEVEYEVTVKEDGNKIDVTVEKDGVIKLLEKDILLKNLPMAVSETLAKMYAEDTPASAEAVFELEDGEEELEFYEVQLKSADGIEFEAKITANGKVVKDGDERSETEEQEEKH